MNNVRFFINKENFEKNKSKFAADFDASVKDDQDKGKYYLVDMPLASLPNTFSINNRAIEIDAATSEKDKPTIIYVKLSADLNPYAEIKIFAFMIERYHHMKEAMVTALDSS